MAHSQVVNEMDRRIGNHLFVELHRTDEEIKRLQDRIEILRAMHFALKICPLCTGGGTVCKGRTDDDMPNYQPCRSCGGKGHNRS